MREPVTFCYSSASPLALGHAWLPAAAANRQADLPGVLFSRQLLAARHLKVSRPWSSCTASPFCTHDSQRLHIPQRLGSNSGPVPPPRGARLEARLHPPDLLPPPAADPQTTRPAAGSALRGSTSLSPTIPEDAEACAHESLERAWPPISIHPSPRRRTARGPVHHARAVSISPVPASPDAAAVFLLVLIVLGRRAARGGPRAEADPPHTRPVAAQVLLEGAIMAGAGAAFGMRSPCSPRARSTSSSIGAWAPRSSSCASPR